MTPPTTSPLEANSDSGSAMARLLPTLFSSLTLSLARTGSAPTTPTRWTLRRTLKSENPNDIQGELHGSASFAPLRPTPTTSSSTPTSKSTSDINADTATTTTTATDDTKETETKYKDLLYSEEGSLPPIPTLNLGAGLRWTKKYIWRLSNDGRISVWFVKVDKTIKDGEEEADYLFHEFDFITGSESSGDEKFVEPPTPPEVRLEGGRGTRVLAARGNHLCINDMYRTAYAFRVDEGSGEVVSWASRHVVKGPKKGQDIVNIYERGV
ncbi:hypothetical protein BJX99DRAFT_136314 [Aspergillus californicus]